MKGSKVSFAHFLEKFPELPLPITLNNEAHHAFSRENDPLSPLMIEQYILPLEDLVVDEFTEFVACFRIPETHGFHAVVYWRASLLDYQYKLATFTRKGELIDIRIIAGTFSDGETLIQSFATIEEDWEILVVSGQVKTGQKEPYDASSSTTYSLELLPDGTIINQS